MPNCYSNVPASLLLANDLFRCRSTVTRFRGLMPAADAEEKCLFYLNLSAEQTIIIFKLYRPEACGLIIFLLVPIGNCFQQTHFSIFIQSMTNWIVTKKIAPPQKL